MAKKKIFVNAVANDEGEQPTAPVVKVSKSIAENIKVLTDTYGNDKTLAIRRFQNPYNPAIKCCIFFLNGLADNQTINKDIMLPIMKAVESENEKSPNLLDLLQNKIISSNSIDRETNMTKLMETINYGDTGLFVEGYDEALYISSKGWRLRAIQEPNTEMSIRGPREGFTESIMDSLAHIRRKLTTKDLKFEFSTLGTRTQTRVCICYIDGVVNKNILNELKTRLDKIDMDSLLDSGYIQEYLKDSPYSIFETMDSTERPDVVVGKLLEGRIAVVVDGTPVVLTLPFLFLENFQISEDYYVGFFYGSLNRLLRIISLFLTTLTGASYLALVTYHQELIPTTLAIAIASSKVGVPLPTVIELISMVVIFEVIRESGTRMPSFLGQALSIVGVLVIGQAAVEARFISAPIVIIVAVTGITGLIIPRMKSVSILLRLMFILLASFLGFFGIIFGIIGVCLYLFQLRSFGVPYMYKADGRGFEGIVDTAIRAPLWAMKKRPKMIAEDAVRNASTRSKK